MAYRIIDKQYCACVDDYRLTIIADKDEDILDLPLACVGSTVIVADRGNEYIANTEGGWVFKSGDESRAVKYVVGAKEIAGTWQFNDTLTGGGWWDFDFIIGSTNGKSLAFDDNRLVWEYDWDGDNIVDSDEVLYESWWYSGTAPTLTTSATVDSVTRGDTLLAWLNANATKIAEPEGGNDEGGSSDALAGKWKFNTDLYFDKRYDFDIEFTVPEEYGNDVLYNRVKAYYNDEAHLLDYHCNDDSMINPYSDLGGWTLDTLRTINIVLKYEDYDRADELLAFLNKYATKIS